MQRRAYHACDDRWIGLHELLRCFFVLGLEHYEPERLVEGFGSTPGEDDLVALGGFLQVLEVPSDRRPVFLGPRALGMEPGGEPQDVEPGQNVSRAAPSPSVNVFG